MTLTQRRILYIFFFIIFFSLLPVIILWAQGYKLNFNNWTFQKTGVLFLESDPDSANIYLDGQIQSDKTETRIKNLLPKEYFVEIKKEGYQDWSKKLKVLPSTTTFAQYVQLFLNDLPTKSLTSQNITFSQNIGDSIFYITNNEDQTLSLQKINSKNESVSTILTNSSNYNNIIANEPQDSLLLNINNSWEYLDTETKKLTALTSYYSFDIKNPEFDKKQDKIFYGITPKGIRKFDLSIPSANIVIPGQIIDFTITKDNEIIYLIANLDKIELTKSPLSNTDKADILSSLPFSTGYKIYDSPQGIINLVDHSNDIFYIFDFDAKIFSEKKLIIPEVKKIAWHDNNKSLLFANDFEIWIYRKDEFKEDYEKRLISRLGTKIKDVIWFPIDTHLIYFTDDAMYISEIFDGEKFVVSFNKIRNVQDSLLKKSDKTLFWLTEHGIYKSKLQ